MNKNIRAAFYFTMDFQKRVLIPIANHFKERIITNDLNELKNFRPDFVFTADYSCKTLSEFFRNENVFIMAVRHGAVNKYSEPEDDFSYADFIFGTEYEKKYLESGNVKPRMKFIVTGNPWVDETFRIPNRLLNQNTPTILFAPTYNPEISAAAIPGNKLYELISKVFSDFNLIIKPHPAILDRRFEHLRKYEKTFDEWIAYWKYLEDNFKNVRFIDNPSESISKFFEEADILVSDRSSLIWEFIILERPVLLYRSNNQPELWNQLITDLSIDNKLDVGAGYEDINQFADSLGKIFDLHENYYQKNQQNYKHELFGKFQDGWSSFRIAHEIKKIYEEELSNNIIEVAESYIQNNSFEQANKLLNKALQFDKFKTEALNDLAYIEIVSDNFNSALNHITEALILNPNDEIAWNNLNYLLENDLIDSDNIQERLNSIFRVPLSIKKIFSFEDYLEYDKSMRVEYRRRNEFEKKLIPDKLDEFIYNGFCIVCNEVVQLKVDFWNAYKNNGERVPNWRERLVCPNCNLNNRMRLTYHIIKELFPDFRSSAVYITEQTTALFNLLKKLNRNLIGSEYLGESVSKGAINNYGIRNEDFTELSFNDGQFDLLVSLEVLEHIPDYQKALNESYRVLNKKGKFLFTVPFNKNSKSNIIRAKIDNGGNLIHLLPPEYHGNPLNSRNECLCYYHFGWEILDDLRNVGYEKVFAVFTYSKEYGYLGGEQIFFIAEKGN
ncbi:MAG: CDP-glycerol glycerophosphotransferase family protein [Ignavibacterium album]|uniref:methyltransferase domain-containing protein n=1 Tax=Ignavibacterium album TaxID=591197 RepID=UPI0026EF840C|nr:methyltransferase domain-containing protein [Ignavibacterium album]MCX8105016.1 CDP-glycerol glycerophosphotransferase family protein [Ignavibacterium album]